MTNAQHGNTVHIHYTGRFSDGTVFDTSDGREPLAFELGSGQVIPGLDKAMRGMAVGEKKTVEIPCAEAFGEHHAEGVQEVPRDQMPAEMDPQVGMQLQAEAPNGEAVMLVVTAVANDIVTVDANHPLAGKDLTFDVELVSVA
ncbi:MAG: peptidylprolyl isomerase [Pseudomonadota bacterium]